MWWKAQLIHYGFDVRDDQHSIENAKRRIVDLFHRHDLLGRLSVPPSIETREAELEVKYRIQQGGRIEKMGRPVSSGPAMPRQGRIAESPNTGLKIRGMAE